MVIPHNHLVSNWELALNLQALSALKKEDYWGTKAAKLLKDNWSDARKEDLGYYEAHDIYQRDLAFNSN